ncbi:hypothetical protein [Isoptericola aurantiacus]|uniref:hypothetical protein n=1 Tax=Isoptericola aurantiacus TaxID=3377839 RepID=UPI00383AD3ED
MTTGPPSSVVVHLSVDPATTRTIHRWCRAHGPALAARGITARTDPKELRDAVTGLDLRSDHGRRQLRGYVADGGPVLWSSGQVLGPVYRFTGGDLLPAAASAVAGIDVATRDATRHVALTLVPHGRAVMDAYVESVRAGHAVAFDDFVASLPRQPSWTPLVRRLVEVFGADRVTARIAGTDTSRQVLTEAERVLAAGPDRGPLPDPPAESRPAAPWTPRMVALTLAALPHLRSYEERGAWRRFVETRVDRADAGSGIAPALGLAPAQEDRLARCDAEDMASIQALVEVR